MSPAAPVRVRPCRRGLLLLLLTFVSLALAGAAAAGSPTVVRAIPEERAQYSTTYLLSNGQIDGSKMYLHWEY